MPSIQRRRIKFKKCIHKIFSQEATRENISHTLELKIPIRINISMRNFSKLRLTKVSSTKFASFLLSRKFVYPKFSLNKVIINHKSLNAKKKNTIELVHKSTWNWKHKQEELEISNSTCQPFINNCYYQTDSQFVFQIHEIDADLEVVLK